VVVDIGDEAAGFGRNVKINHGGGIIIIYAHECCWDYSTIVVHKGDQVTAGQVLGNVGATGDATGPHLHLEIRRYEVDSNGQPYWNRPYTRVLDVADFFRSHGVDVETKQEQATGGQVN
jgi:murein DD-endopeptidase MepM/ murein hydrolase activator NlpD